MQDNKELDLQLYTGNFFMGTFRFVPKCASKLATVNCSQPIQYLIFFPLTGWTLTQLFDRI